MIAVSVFNNQNETKASIVLAKCTTFAGNFEHGV